MSSLLLLQIALWLTSRDSFSRVSKSFSSCAFRSLIISSFSFRSQTLESAKLKKFRRVNIKYDVLLGSAKMNGLSGDIGSEIFQKLKLHETSNNTILGSMRSSSPNAISPGF